MPRISFPPVEGLLTPTPTPASCKPLHPAPPQGKATAEVLTGASKHDSHQLSNSQVQQELAAETPASPQPLRHHMKAGGYCTTCFDGPGSLQPVTGGLADAEEASRRLLCSAWKQDLLPNVQPWGEGGGGAEGSVTTEWEVKSETISTGNTHSRDSLLKVATAFSSHHFAWKL